MTGLLDVNVLVALADSIHPFHHVAHRWFESTGRKAWATCPLTLNGCVRVLSNPKYSSFQTTPREVISRLRDFCDQRGHVSWTLDVSILDEAIRPHEVAGPQTISDTCLLALAVRNEGALITFDRRIVLRAVRGATKQHLTILSSPSYT